MNGVPRVARPCALFSRALTALVAVVVAATAPAGSAAALTRAAPAAATSASGRPESSSVGGATRAASAPKSQPAAAPTSQPAAAATSQPVAAALQEAVGFDSEAYLEHVRYLASDELGGREPGSAGIELAAEYIARQFERVGLRPAGSDGTYFQPFTVRRGKKLDDNEAALEVGGLDGTWTVRKDWIPLPYTLPYNVEAPLAFAGYGIDAPEFEWNDYEGFDATGKALLIFRYEPAAGDPDARFGGQTPSRHAMFRRKARVAARAGAQCLLVVNPPLREGDDALVAWQPEATEQTFEMPMIHVSRALADALVRKAGLPPLADLQRRLDEDRKPLSADLKGLTLRLKMGVTPNRIPARNVLALLPGVGSTDETLVVGAHYDHLGTRPAPTSGGDPVIYNGADDNASGTAGVLELARVLAATGGLRRNILFIAFSAEELGLLGSTHWVENPTVPLEQVKAMFNFDMIGRLEGKEVTLYGQGTAAEFAALLEAAATSTGLTFRAARGVPAVSDHAPFHRRGIPVLFAFTGVHKEYHRPEDDWQRIDAPGAVRILELFAEIIRNVANMPSGPTFSAAAAGEPIDMPGKQPAIDEARTEGPPDGNAGRTPPGAPATRPAGEAETRPSDDGEPRQPERPRVRLGIVPDMAGGVEPGVVVQGVMEGSPAQAAGMREGDRIIRIGPHTITDIYSYMDALRDHQAGDVVEVVVVRNQAEKAVVRLKVTLAASGPRRPTE